MKCLFIVGVCALFVAVNAKDIFSDLYDEEVEELELNEDDLSSIDKRFVSVSIPGFPKPSKPIFNPVNLCMRDIIDMIRINRREGMEMFKQFIASAIQTIVDEVGGHHEGWRPTWPPTKKPSGDAHTRPHSNGPSGSTINNDPSGSALYKLLRRGVPSRPSPTKGPNRRRPSPGRPKTGPPPTRGPGRRPPSRRPPSRRPAPTRRPSRRRPSPGGTRTGPPPTRKQKRR